jgi:hypothetical protein
MVAGHVSFGPGNDGAVLSLHDGLRQGIRQTGGDIDDLFNSGCSDLLVCLFGRGPDTAGMVLIKAVMDI